MVGKFEIEGSQHSYDVDRITDFKQVDRGDLLLIVHHYTKHATKVKVIAVYRDGLYVSIIAGGHHGVHTEISSAALERGIYLIKY